MITDRFTAKVLGLLLIVFPLIIDVSFLLLSKPELRHKAGFVAFVFVSTLPFVVGGAFLLRRADRLKDTQ